MKKIILSMCIMAFAGFAFNLQAQNAKESFDYPTGALNVTSGDATNGWSTGWDLGQTIANITTNPLIYNASSHGNSAILQGNEWGEITRNLKQGEWPDEAGKIYWLSCLHNLLTDPYPKEQYGGIAIYGANGVTSGKNLYMGMQWTDVAGTGVYLVEVNNSDEQLKGSNKQIVPNEPIWWVAKIVMSGDASPETVYIWINPDPMATDLNVDEAYVTSPNMDFNGGLAQVRLNCHNGIQVQFDELRLGTSWNDVNIFKNDLGTGVSKTLENSLSLNCYPSPISTTSKISYSLSSAQQVKLVIYNTMGKQVAVLANSYQEAGKHEINFSADGLNSGIYICKLLAGNQISVKSLFVKR